MDILPFKLSNARLNAYSEWPSVPFWRSLKSGYDIFEKTHVPAMVSVRNRNYVFAVTK